MAKFFLVLFSIKNNDRILAAIETVTPQQGVGEFEGLVWESWWSEEYEWIAGNSF